MSPALTKPLQFTSKVPGPPGQPVFGKVAVLLTVTFGVSIAPVVKPDAARKLKAFVMAGYASLTAPRIARD